MLFVIGVLQLLSNFLSHNLATLVNMHAVDWLRDAMKMNESGNCSKITCMKNGCRNVMQLQHRIVAQYCCSDSLRILIFGAARH